MKRTPLHAWLLSFRTSTCTLDHPRWNPPLPPLMTHHHPQLSKTLPAPAPHERLPRPTFHPQLRQLCLQTSPQLPQAQVTVAAPLMLVRVWLVASRRLGYREAAQALQPQQRTLRQRWQALGHLVPAPASHSTTTTWPKTPKATRYMSRSVSRTTMAMTYEDDVCTLSSRLHD